MIQMVSSLITRIPKQMSLPRHSYSIHESPSLPKSKKVTVISKTGINCYKSSNLSGKVKHYKNGTVLY